jgi:hypothetical protein
MHGVSLRGIMKLLFASEDEREIDLSQERWSADEPEATYAVGAPEDGLGNAPSPPPPPEAIPKPSQVCANRLNISCLALRSQHLPRHAPQRLLPKPLSFPFFSSAKSVRPRQRPWPREP